MKRIILFFTVCLGLSVSQTIAAVDSDVARAATKRATTTNANNSNTNRVVTSDAKRAATPQTKNVRTATKTSQPKVVSRTSVAQASTPTRKSVSLNTKTSSSDPVNIAKRISSSRNATSTRTATRSAVTPQTTNNARTTRSTANTNGAKRTARAAELSSEKIANIKSADYSKCKTVYYECMDEFCANKDTDLRRCACSSRIHEFDNIKKQLSDAEDKMLDFNQRLLTVSMDKEDAAAINVATEGELAFQKKDTSESEKLLQKITKTLNSSGDSKINNNLSAISLSLDMDSAWDDIDSLAGASTTSKSGLDLYNAARPVCIEMAREVCTDDELSIAQDGYKLTIQQDCNTVAKSYDTLYNNAINKIHESGALLDISRLSIYQQRNADDILTCKKKILAQLSDASVCGENLYKCLDVTGQYIDPLTGKAFLSEELYNLTNLLQEPAADEKWSKITQNESFVNFLNSKQEFLKPATEQCRDISDTVWKEFLDDALSQIKLAQNAKMEEIKQSCTTLVAECKTDALNDLSEFDSRALSIFKVAADKTANEMCSNIQNSCIALTEYSGVNLWGSGMASIAKDITYDAIIDTCTQIGRDCIIQKCNGAAGNFALCKSATSDNRMTILKRNACWNEVLNCVRGADNLDKMNELPIIANRDGYYASLYSNTSAPALCASDDTACLIAEQIWGNCETQNDNTAISTYNISGTITSNNILMPNNGSTLLSWIATNTGSQSCNTYGCPANYQLSNGRCQLLTQNGPINQIINVTSNLTNICSTGVRDTFGNCCENGQKSNGICVHNTNENALLLTTGTCSTNDSYYCPGYTTSNPRIISFYCMTSDNSIDYDSMNDEYTCNGQWVLIDQYGNYFALQGQTPAPTMSYTNDQGTLCRYTYNYSNDTWSFDSTCADIDSVVPTNNEFSISY